MSSCTDIVILENIITETVNKVKKTTINELQMDSHYNT